IREYIEIFYNRQRRHSRLGNISPAALKPDTMRNVFRCHIPRYEAIIARYLDMEPAQIWPSRYMEKTSC
uniref:helix-turn-helix domain-containing protein n=1 Tax=Shigella sp. FJ200513 TaxID=3156214 RepID=UPI0033930057